MIITVRNNKLELLSNGEIIVIDGTALQSDAFNDFDSIADRFRGFLRTSDILSSSLYELIIQFTDKVPQVIKWFDYYLDWSGNFVYATPKDVLSKEGAAVNTVEDVCKSTILNLGLSRGQFFISSEHIVYRGIRIVCEYEDLSVEYLVVFDAPFRINPRLI